MVRCCIEHASSVAKTFLTSDAVVIDMDGPVPEGMRPSKESPKPMPMPIPASDNSIPTRRRNRSEMKLRL